MNFIHIATIFLLALLPAAFWLTLYYLKDFKDPEPKKIVAITFLAGALITIPFLIIDYGLAKFSFTSVYFNQEVKLIIFAFFEEIAKLSAAIFIISRHKQVFNQIIDGVVYAVSAALGFAFAENLVYFIPFLYSGMTGDFFNIVIFRGLGTMVAHTVFSGIAGLIWAYAVFSKQITPFQKKGLLAFELKDFINREVLSLHIIRRNILMAHSSRRGGHEKKILVLEGIMLATFLHIIFNLTTTFKIFGQNLTFILVPGIVAGLLYIFFLYTKKLNQKILKVI